MALLLKDRVKETTTTAGLGTLTLAGSADTFEPFSSLGNGNTTYYAIVAEGNDNWEVGIGTVGTGTLSRDTVLASSNSNAKVDFPAGTKDVFVTYPAGKVVSKDDATGINSGISLADYVDFDTAAAAAGAVGRLKWNDQDGTLDLGVKGGNVTLQVGQEQLIRVVNKVGASLLEANYQCVKISGAQGQRPKVALAQANNDLNSADTIGLVTETIADNQEGFVTTSGIVRNINTTGSLQGESWNDGDVLYLSGTTAGQITNVKPSAPTHTVIVGFVIYAHINQGKIFVKVDNGYELDELHNVNITSPSNGQVLTYNNGLWENQTIGSGTVTSVSVVSANGLSGSVANSTTTPAITLSTSVSGLLKGSAGALAAASATDVPELPQSKITNLVSDLAAKAPLASPALTGTPTAPTAAVGTNTTQVATTEFVNAEIANDAPSKTGTGASGTWGISVTGNAGTVTNGVYTTGNQTIGGTKTFSSDVILSGIAANSVLYLTASKYVTGGATLSFDGSTLNVMGTVQATSFAGALTGNASTVTNGVYTTGDQTIGGTKTFSSTISGSVSGNAGTATTLQATPTINNVTFAGNANITVPRVRALDDRILAPADGSANYVTAYFTSWANDNTSPYADALLFRTWADGSGGNDNLVTFRKNALGMRIWQQTSGSATAFSSFKDVAWTDGTNATGTWTINTSGSAATLTTARTLTIGATGKTFNGSANVSWTVAEIGAVGTSGNETITGDKTFSGTTALSATSTINGAVIGFRDVPVTIQNATYSFALADAGKAFGKDNTTAYTYTIPANASVAFPVGTVITVFNNNATSNITVAITTDTLRLAGTTTTGSRTVAPFSLCTLFKVSSTVWMASGAGVT
jgi:hypothetical protein